MLALGGARRQRALNPASAGKPITLFSLCRHRTPSTQFTTGGNRATPFRPPPRPRPPPPAPGRGGHCWRGAPPGLWAGSLSLPPRGLQAVGPAMGQCLPCMGGAVKDVVETPDPASSRGIKNAYAVEQKKKKQEEIEKRIAASRPGGEGGLRCLWNATIRCHVFGAVLVMQLGIENICAEDRHKRCLFPVLSTTRKLHGSLLLALQTVFPMFHICMVCPGHILIHEKMLKTFRKNLISTLLQVIFMWHNPFFDLSQ
ncbi:small VCP/p97-interacting protein isoform 4-T4 [Cyanocitta cristata]